MSIDEKLQAAVDEANHPFNFISLGDMRKIYEEWVELKAAKATNQPVELSSIERIKAIIKMWFPLDAFNSEIEANRLNGCCDEIASSLKRESSKPDAAEALSKAILEAHEKWAAEYCGVSHA